MNDDIKTILADVTAGERLEGTKSFSGTFERYDEKTDELFLRVVGGDELVVIKGEEIVSLNKNKVDIKAAKEVVFDSEARTALQRGVDILSNSVKVTLGPK